MAWKGPSAATQIPVRQSAPSTKRQEPSGSYLKEVQVLNTTPLTPQPRLNAMRIREHVVVAATIEVLRATNGSCHTPEHLRAGEVEQPRSRIASQVAASRGKSSAPNSLKLRREDHSSLVYLQEADMVPAATSGEHRRRARPVDSIAESLS